MKPFSHWLCYCLGYSFLTFVHSFSNAMGIHQRIYVGGEHSLYSKCINSTYKVQQTLYNNQPVYKRLGLPCLKSEWYVFYRNNRWNIFYQSPSEGDHSGVLTGHQGLFPWDNALGNSIIATPIRVISVKGFIAISRCTLGDYHFANSVFNNKPVYQRNAEKCLQTDWFLYYDTNNHWTIGYTHPAQAGNHSVTEGIRSDWPWDKIWPGGGIISMNYIAEA